VIYAMDAEGERLFCERIDNDALRLLEVVSAAGDGAEVVIEVMPDEPSTSTVMPVLASRTCPTRCAEIAPRSR
jgi:hypothetical protein